MPSTNQSITVNQSVEKVWDTISNFHDMSWCPNVVTSCVPEGDAGGGEVGAKRVLNAAFHETLIEVNADDHVIRYSIDDGPPPVSSVDVSNYVGEIKLSAADGGATLVEWSSSWESSSEAAVEFCQGIYVALLGDMANTLK
ncbi:MAG: SRPBCC family protein [Proteobacteria bacterium]|nr:SRPBCC family protein [Pseudomonadota bacterium]